MPATLPLGTIIQDRYRIESVLGSTRPGALYLVRDQSSHQHLFALKEMSNSGAEGAYRFIFEHAEFKKKFVHPALPQIYSMFHDEKHDRVYILMEYIEGLNLEAARLMQPEQHFSLTQMMTIISPIVDAVSYLHSQHPPLIHGCIKPSNIIESTDTSTVLVDFDFEKEFDAEKTTIVAPHAKSGYEAPEQYRGEISPRTDIYALGTTLYTLLTGSVPSGALYRWKKLGKKELDPLVPVNQIVPAIPGPVGEVIDRAMSVNSDDRFSTVEQFWEALRQASNAVTTNPQTTGPGIAAQSEEKMPTEANSPVQQAVEPLIGGEEASILTAIPIVQQPQEVVAASTDFPPAISQEIQRATTAPLWEPARFRRFNKSRMPFLALFALLVTLLASAGVGGSLWYYVVYHGSGSTTSSSTLPTAIPHSRPPSTAVTTPTPTFPINIAGVYYGTIFNIRANVTTEMTLTGIQQDQRSISGNFSGLNRVGVFQGVINLAKHVKFIVTDSTGRLMLSFVGDMQYDGELSGNYCSVNQKAQCTGEYGLWSVAPE